MSCSTIVYTLQQLYSLELKIIYHRLVHDLLSAFLPLHNIYTYVMVTGKFIDGESYWWSKRGLSGVELEGEKKQSHLATSFNKKNSNVY